MAVITTVPEQNIWNEICKGYYNSHAITCYNDETVFCKSVG
jgi:hypothetical protein